METDAFAALHRCIWDGVMAGDPLATQAARQQISGQFDRAERFLYFAALDNWGTVSYHRALLAYWLRWKRWDRIAAYKQRLDQSGIRASTLDYLEVKALIGAGDYDAADARLDRMGLDLGRDLGAAGIPTPLPDLNEGDLDRIIADHARLSATLSDARHLDWAETEAVARGPDVDFDLTRRRLRHVMRLGAVGPTLGINNGEWRSFAIRDHRTGDEVNDFKYDSLTVQPDLVDALERGRRQMMRLYNAVFARWTLDRFGAGQAGRDMVDMVAPRAALPELRDPLLTTGDGATVATSIRDLVMYERLLWLRDAMADLKALGLTDTTEGLSVVEIGGGYGHLVRNLVLSGFARSAVLVDRPINLTVSRRYLWPHIGMDPGIAGLSPPGGPNCPVSLVPPWLLAGIGGSLPAGGGVRAVDLGLNFISFQHMARRNVEYYLDFLKACGTRFLIHENIRSGANLGPLAETPLRRDFVPIYEEVRQHSPREIVRELMVRRSVLEEAGTIPVGNGVADWQAVSRVVSRPGPMPARAAG